MDNTVGLMPEMSEKFDIVMKSLMLAKREMGSCVKKDASNPFHKSRYASLAAHLELCESRLDKHGLIMIQTGNGSHEKPMLVATLCHPESGQWIKSYLPLPNPKGDSQGLGASLTYMRRYSINSMLGLTAEDDDGETASGRGKHEDYKKEQKEASAPKPTQKLSSDQVQILTLLEKKLDSTCINKINTWLKSTYNTITHSELPTDNFKKILGTYENAVKYMQTEKMELMHA